MKKVSVWLLVLVMVLGVFALVGCGDNNGGQEGGEGEGGEEAAYTADDPLVMRIAYSNAPTDSSVISGTHWSEMLAEVSEGAIELQVFTSGELGGTRETFSALQEGTLDMTSVCPCTVASFDARFEIVGLPGLFADEEQAVKYVDEGWLDEYMDQVYEENGIYRLVNGEPNFYILFMTPKAGEATSIADLKGKKIRIAESPMMTYYMTAIESIPTTLAWAEIYTSLQRNVIDGTPNNWIWGIAAKFGEVATAASELPLQYYASDWLMSKSLYDQVPEYWQNMIEETIPEIQTWSRDHWNAEVETNKADFVAAGGTIYEPTEEQLAEFRTTSYEAWKDYAVGVWGEDVVGQLEDIINEQ